MEELVRTGDDQVIRYRTMPVWVLPTVYAYCAAASLFVLFSGVLFSTAIFSGLALPHTAIKALEVCVRIVLLAVIAFFAYLVRELARDEKILITKDGISFPIGLGPSLLFRRKRRWDDIASILLGAMLLEDAKGTYEYELEQAADRRRAFIYFRSGGHVMLDLNKMPRQNQEKLFQAVESWCITCTRSPQLADKLKKEKAKKVEELSYTKLWEEELHSHFSATNFVPLEKGDTLQSDKYTVLMQLASGGLSAVYLADIFDRDLVVIKEAALPANLEESSRQKAKQMFEREAKILRQLNHPNIAKILDNFVERGRDYLVLEFVPGESLRQIVRKRGTQSEQMVLQYARKLAVVLDYLHDQKPQIIHRDLTPDNIVVREDGELIVIDFGAANLLLSTATGTLVGKQAYIAPEQFRGKAVAQSDIYALGCTLYFLLTGEDPDALSISYPRGKRDELSIEIDQLVAGMTRIRVEDRIGSADELIEKIEQVMPATKLSLS